MNVTVLRLLFNQETKEEQRTQMRSQIYVWMRHLLTLVPSPEFAGLRLYYDRGPKTKSSLSFERKGGHFPRGIHFVNI